MTTSLTPGVGDSSSAEGSPTPSARPTAGDVLRALVLVGSCVVAFHISLRTLSQALLIDSPLAYLGLVPAAAFAVTVLRVRRVQGEPDIEDRQIDVIVGTALVGAAILGEALLRQRLGQVFWIWRLDLLSLPVFAAGAVALVLGVRTMWRVRLGLALLLAAWPVPWSWLVSSVQAHVSAWTTATVASVAAPVGLAQSVPGSDGSLFALVHDGHPLRLSVASACGGLNGTVSYAVVALLLLSVTRGSKLRKLLWLVAGLVLAWMLNVARIMVIFAVARTWGLSAAMDVLHPVLGLLLANIGILLMLSMLGRFGLRLVGREPRQPAVGRTTAPGRSVPVAATSVLLVAAVFGAGLNSSLAADAGLGDTLSGTRVASLSTDVALAPGWSTANLGDITWTKQYFGSGSTWRRKLLVLSPQVAGARLLGVSAPVPVLMDVVTTPDLLRLRTYSVKACYQFHGFRLHEERAVRLRPGLRGTVISYWDPRDGRDWSTLSWEQPVRTDGGGTAYERVVLMVVDTRSYVLPELARNRTGLAPTVTGVVSGRSEGTRLEAGGRLLVALARDVVTNQERRGESSDGVVRTTRQQA